MTSSVIRTSSSSSSSSVNGITLIASERSERAQSSSCSIEISDTCVYIYICGRTSSYVRMLCGT